MLSFARKTLYCLFKSIERERMHLKHIKEMIKQRHQRTPLKNTLYDMKEKFKRPIVTVTCERTIKYLVNNKGMSYSEAVSIANKLLNNNTYVKQ